MNTEKLSRTNFKKILILFCLLVPFGTTMAQVPAVKSFFVGGMMLFHADRANSRPFLLWQKSPLLESSLHHFTFSSYSTREGGYRLLQRVRSEEVGPQTVRYSFTPVVKEGIYFSQAISSAPASLPALVIATTPPASFRKASIRWT